jgi:uncharacterized protein
LLTPPPQNNETALVPHPDPLPSSVAEDGVEVLCDGPEAKASGPKRRDVASHQSFDTSELIRFVVSPEGGLTPDLAHKLPGRGLWVKADRSSLDVAIKKNLFARAAKRQVRVEPGLIDQVHGLLRQRCLQILGLARREGQLLTGFEKIQTALKSPKATSSLGWLVEATDGAEDGRRKLLNIIDARQLKTKVAGCFNNEELSLALGLENAIHVAILEGRRSERWSFEIKRLAGFEPLRPTGWSQAAHRAPDAGPSEITGGPATFAPTTSAEDG